MVPICEKIEELRKEKGWSRRKLAITAGISPSSLQSVFERETGISANMLSKIATALEVHPSEFFGVSQHPVSDSMVDHLVSAFESTIRPYFNKAEHLDEACEIDNAPMHYVIDATATTEALIESAPIFLKRITGDEV